MLNLAEFLLSVTPRTSRAGLDESGLVNVPASMLFVSRRGIRRLISPKSLIKMAKAGLNRAVSRAEIFHLWFHPSNFAYRTEDQFQALEAILRYASELRQQGQARDTYHGGCGTDECTRMNASAHAASSQERRLPTGRAFGRKFKWWNV